MPAQPPGPGGPLAGGQVAAAFNAQALSGRKINFPEDYRGRLVLIDFWATWCAPCLEEIPNLRKASERFRSRGLEIIGVSLDRGAANKVRSFITEQKMDWEQIVAGAEEIAGKYGVTGIPNAFLIDGTTGRILARDAELRGSKLLATVEKHLQAR